MHHTEQAIRLYRAAGYRPGEAVCLNDIGWHHAKLGDYEVARRDWLEALHIYDEIDHPDADEIRAKLQPPGAQPESSSA